MAAKWWRYNSTSHIFEQSLDEGTTWTVPPLNASIITEGVFAPARLGGNLAYTDQANTFSQPQTMTSWLSVGGAFDAWAASNLRGEVNVTGGSGTGYSTAPIEIMTTATPRISFHWPGVVASQIGMDSAGVIKALDNPGTGLAAFSCGALTCIKLNSTSTPNYVGDLTVYGGTNFCAGVTASGGNITAPGYLQTVGVHYPGRVDLYGGQGSWYWGGHASYGLYCNTGIYVVGPVIGAVYNNHGGYYGFIKTHALTYTNPNALDDYEEGEWTPTVEFDSGEAEYTERNASYTKIGRLVFVAGKVLLSSKGTGKARVTALPFIPEHRVNGPRYIPDLEVNQPAYFEFSYQAPT